MTTTAPKTPSAMFDLLHFWFGIGSYDEAITDRPWHRERMVEIAKLKRMLKSRRATLTEVYIAAKYARDNQRNIHSTWQVFALIPEAMRERFRAATNTRREEARTELADAIDKALASGDVDLAEQLMRSGDLASHQ